MSKMMSSTGSLPVAFQSLGPVNLNPIEPLAVTTQRLCELLLLHSSTRPTVSKFISPADKESIYQDGGGRGREAEGGRGVMVRERRGRTERTDGRGEEARKVQRKRQDFPKQTTAERRREVPPTSTCLLLGWHSNGTNQQGFISKIPGIKIKSGERESACVWRSVIKRRHKWK